MGIQPLENYLQVICGACRKEYNDYQELIKHKEECVVLEELKQQRILSIRHTGPTVQHGPIGERYKENPREWVPSVKTDNVLLKSSVVTGAYNQLSTSVDPVATLQPPTNLTPEQLPVPTEQTVLQTSLIATSVNSNIDISQHGSGETVVLQPQIVQKPPYPSSVVPDSYSAKSQHELVSSGNQAATPVGHEYARQALEEGGVKEEDPSSSQPVCQIVTTNNERYLIITNTGQGDICIPITDENKDVLTLLQSFMKDSNEQGSLFTTNLQKATDDLKDRHFTNQQELASNIQNPGPPLLPNPDVNVTNTGALHSLLGQQLPKPVLYPQPMGNNIEGIQNLTQPILQMQLDHNASFSLLSPSHVNSSILSDSSHNAPQSQQHLSQESIHMPTVVNPNPSLPRESSTVNVPVSEINVNTTSDITPLLISTDHHNLQKLADIPLTPNTVLTSLGNLSKYANTDNIETTGIHSVDNGSIEPDRHVNHNITEGSLQNLEMSSVVYMGDNSYSVHFQTQGKSNQSNLSNETLCVDPQEVGLNQLVEDGVTTSSQTMDGKISLENQMVEGGVSMTNEEEVQESQVVEQLHQAYLRTQQNKEKQLSQQLRATKAKQTTVEKSPLESKQKHTRKKKYKCSVRDCNFVSAYMKDLERHMRVHTGERPYSCEYCNKSFSRLDKLRLHIRGHTGEKPFKCELCNYRAVDNGSIKKHMAVHSNDKPIKCQTCPYACRTSSQLVVHLRKHTGDAPFSCLYCDSKFKIKSDMKRHMRTHTGEKPFRCEQCEFSCSAKSNLVSHYNVHHSSTQLTCESCDFSTSSKRSFYEHQKTHSTPDPENICKVCQYVCSNKQTLKTHMINAHNFKLYVCKDCNFCSKSMKKARYHYNTCGSSRKSSTHHRKPKKNRNSREDDSQSRKYEKNYVCDICEEAFVRKDSLNSHLKLHRERTQSTLSTALTVLELQQPVINNTAPPPERDQKSDMEVVTISSSFGNRKEDHTYDREVVNISSSAENQKEGSPLETRRSRGRSNGRSHRIDSLYETQHRRKSAKPNSTQTASLENFEKCKPSTNTALRISKNLEQSRYNQYDSRNTVSHSEESSGQDFPRTPEVLPTVVVSVSQTDLQSDNSAKPPQAVIINPCSGPPDQSSNIQVVQNITVPIIQLNNGQIMAMQQIGSASNQVFSLTPLAVNQMVGAQESTSQVTTSSSLSAEGLMQMFSPNSYISILPQPLIQQASMPVTESIVPSIASHSCENQSFTADDNSVLPSIEGSHSNQPAIAPSLHYTNITRPHPNSNMSSALLTSTTTAIESSISSSDSPKYKHKLKASKRNHHSRGLNDSTSQIDVQSIELDDTSYDFNIQDSGLISKDAIGGRGSHL